MSSNCQTILPTGSTGTHRRPACTSGLIETTSLHNLSRRQTHARTYSKFQFRIRFRSDTERNSRDLLS